MVVETRTDPTATASLVEPPIVRLRVWGTDTTHKQLDGERECLIGTRNDCWWQLDDPKGLLSRRHARFVFNGTGWMLSDFKSKNGLHIGRIRHDEIVVEPGLAVTMGGLTVVFESHREIAQRAFLRRILGFADDKLEAADVALQSLRATLKEHKPLMICGDGDLTPIARALHGRMLGSERPFVLSVAKRKLVEESVRSGRNYPRGMDAVAAALTGTLCVVSNSLPRDIDEVRAAVTNPSTRIQLMVCSKNVKKAEEMSAEPIVIPPLSTRRAELEHIVFEYGRDAMKELSAERLFQPAEQAWVIEHCSTSLSDIDKGTMRIVALRKHKSYSAAAEVLGMTHAALLKWLGKRLPLPFKVRS